MFPILPMLYTIQCAVSPPLHVAHFMLNCMFFISVYFRVCRGQYVCDGRRPIREIAPEFPNFDFSELEYDDDVKCTLFNPPGHLVTRARSSSLP